MTGVRVIGNFKLLEIKEEVLLIECLISKFDIVTKCFE